MVAVVKKNSDKAIRLEVDMQPFSLKDYQDELERT